MKSGSFLLVAILFSVSLFAQNVGIGTNTPTEKLEVSGNIKAQNIFANNISATALSGSSVFTGGLYIAGGSAFDFVITENVNGPAAFRKGHGAVGIRYIIAVGGTVAQTGGASNYNSAFVGEIKLFAGTIAPAGWMFCDGQLLPTAVYPDLFFTIGHTYGGDGSVFALPDLKAAVPVGTGTRMGMYTWSQGESSY
jgi:hypothetical protein